MTSNDITEVKQLLSTPKKIAIVPHRSPDGDAMGSTLAMYHFLRKTGHEATVIVPNEFPDFLSWLPGSDQVLVFENDREQCASIFREADIIFALDFNALHRTGDLEHILGKVDGTFIMIDHHEKPEDFARYIYSDTAFGSTCEMVWNFLLSLDGSGHIDKDIATCIYTGILTDSGSFRFPKTTGTTHRIVAELIDLGVENSEIPSLLFDNGSYESLQLLGQALQNLRIIPDRKTSYITLSQQELDRFHYKKGDTEGIVNYGLSIKGIIFTAIFIEHTDEKIIKISFRSHGGFDVNRFSRDHFSGGGHINAAGGKSYLSLEETVRRFEDIVNQMSI